MKQRNQCIDILKGIGISFVLVGHSLGGFIGNVAYSFHIPLFFIVSGLFLPEFTKQNGKTIGDSIKKDYKRLLVPALFSMALIFLLEPAVEYAYTGKCHIPVENIWTAKPEKIGGNLILFGNLWFLFVLFFSKLFFYSLRTHLSDRHLLATCVVLGCFAVYFGQKINPPFMVLQAVSALPFVSMGYYVKKNGGVDGGGIPKWYGFLIFIWIIYLFQGKMNLPIMQYKWFYVPELITASAGTLFWYFVSKCIVKTKYISKIFTFLGTYSLILICAPTIETYCFNFSEMVPQIPFRSIVVIFCKVCWCSICLWACLNVKFLRSIFVP